MSYRKNNLSTRATLEAFPFEQGSFKFAFRGRYTDGRRMNETCVAKTFQDYSRNDELIRVEQDILDAAQRMIDLFNSIQVIPYKVYLNRFEVWDIRDLPDGTQVASSPVLGEQGQDIAMVEPFINGIYGWERYVGVVYNNSSQFFGVDRFDAMAAFTHCTYHISGGKNVLCDLQGGMLDTTLAGEPCDSYYVLTDPVFMSSVSGTYGSNDGGLEIVDKVMQLHRCTTYCDSSWRLPGLPVGQFK